MKKYSYTNKIKELQDASSKFDELLYFFVNEWLSDSGHKWNISGYIWRGEDILEVGSDASKFIFSILKENNIWAKDIVNKIIKSHNFLLNDKFKKLPVKTKFNYYSTEFRKLRLSIFIRDGEICANCGVVPSEGTSLTIDHIKPISKFPELSMNKNNLQVLCWKCNQSKSNIDYTDYRINSS